MMKEEYYWQQFERTGNINDYLNYACTSEESVSKNRIPTHFSMDTQKGFVMSLEENQNIGNEEGEYGYEPGNFDWNSFISHAHGRI
jgi:hypothetical protein